MSVNGFDTFGGVLFVWLAPLEFASENSWLGWAKERKYHNMLLNLHFKITEVQKNTLFYTDR